MCQTCDQARALLRDWEAKQRHERCWYYPDIFRALQALFGLPPNTNPELPPRPEFDLNCNQYANEQYALLSGADPRVILSGEPERLPCQKADSNPGN